MCKTYHFQDPICDCVHISDTVKLCPLFTSLPKNKNQTTFRPKLLTKHCQGLDLLFNGIDYVSVDVQNDNNDIVPTGLDCPNLNLCLVADLMKSCDLCDSEGAVKFLKVKGIEYTFDKAARIEELLGETEAGEVGKDVKGKAVAAGKSGDRFGGESADQSEGSLSERRKVVEGRAKRAREILAKREDGAASKRKRSGLAESTPASMGSDDSS